MVTISYPYIMVKYSLINNNNDIHFFLKKLLHLVITCLMSIKNLNFSTIFNKISQILIIKKNKMFYYNHSSS